MKIEKVNDHQIRCTLTREDLANRELKISELAYGTDKAKDLFRDMMQQASYEFGFEAEDIPLMIEAVPLNPDCIVLIVTKVDDPEELDTRFSKFSPSIRDGISEEDEEEEDGDDDSEEDTIEESAPAMGLFQKMNEQNASASIPKKTTVNSSDPTVKFTTSHAVPNIPDNSGADSHMFLFTSMQNIISLAHIVGNSLFCPNVLYKNVNENNYLLVIEQGNLSRSEFARICNTVSEFGKTLASQSGNQAYLTEHYESVIKSQALQTLSYI